MHSDNNSRDEPRNSSKLNNKDMRSKHRNSDSQIQRLEAYFKVCSQPDEYQRRKLSEELELQPQQIKFWFQNKRTQTKAKNERLDNKNLKEENELLRLENEAMDEALKSVVCPPCGGPNLGKEERKCNLQNLQLENALLKQEYRRLSGQRAIHGGHSIPRGASYINRHVSNEKAIHTQRQLQHFPPLSKMENIAMNETVKKAVAEVYKLISVDQPMWVKSSSDGGLTIDKKVYGRFFTNKSPRARTESSKEVVMVPMEATRLIDVFIDMEKWTRLFPTVVNKAKTIHQLESSILMYEQLHILSPLVIPREFMILRSCKQMEEGVWVIADVSYNLPYVEFEFGIPACSKRPSGCLIQAMPNGFSKVTWMEHVQVNDKVPIHQLYRDLLCSGSGFGAHRWTVTLERMCERLSLSFISVFPTTDHGGLATIEGRRSTMALGERMLRDFARILKMSDKLDFSQLSETCTNAVRVSIRSDTGPGQLFGPIFCASFSLCLPIPPLQVYNFLNNLDVRHQWDVLCNGNPVKEVARFATGTDLKSCVTILQPSTTTENTTGELRIIQDCFIGPLGGMVVYAPVDGDIAHVVVSGQVDPAVLPILPCGFIISCDGRDSGTTLLTAAFQLLGSGSSYYSKDENTVHKLVTSTVQKIKAMLYCDGAQ